jgi:ribosomal protein S4E
MHAILVVRTTPMPATNNPKLKDGDHCVVVAGTHKGKSGTVHDLNISKTGHLTITVVQANGVRFKTLGRNVEVQKSGKSR